ncbi:MAG: DUF4214 domain-containing protein [Xenococcaceae cyanobacterium]
MVSTNEIFNGSAENDNIFGDGTGNTLNGGAGDDRLFGDGTDNQLFGDEGDDRLFSNGTGNTLNGGAGNDELFGDGTSIQLFGDEGNDDLFSSGTDNTINGGMGNDRLFASGNNVRLFGGAEADLFALSVDNNLDISEVDNIAIIEDFQVGEDKLRLPQVSADSASGDSFVSFEELTIIQQEEDTELLLDDDRLAVLTDIQADRITANDFIDADSEFNTDRNVLQLTGGTVQVAYVAYYGRPADSEGEAFWNHLLTTNEVSYAPRNGDTLTGSEQEAYNQIVNAFGTSEEADRLFGSIESNRDKVNRVYQFAFDRDADSEGSDFWTERLDNGDITLVNFALEIALGAQLNDLTVLNNKIDSANLFSNSFDTEAEIAAYRGASAELFGRDWLNDFSDVVSSQAQVDSALADLVNSEL